MLRKWTTNQMTVFQVKLYVGLYHGSDVLGDVQTTSEKAVNNGNCNLETALTFDLEVQDMQPASRLCFTLHGRMKGAKVNTLFWHACSENKL